MADLLNCLVSLPFSLADAAAAPTTAVFLAPGYGSGVPDATDLDGFIMPKAGAVVGMMLMGKPTQAGDFVTAQVYKNGTALTDAVVSNAYAAAAESGATLILGKDDSTGSAGTTFKAGDIIQVKYKTTTGGTYGTGDVGVVVLVQMGLSE